MWRALGRTENPAGRLPRRRTSRTRSSCWRPLCKRGRSIAILFVVGLVGCGGNAGGRLSGSAPFPLPPPANENAYQVVADHHGMLWAAGARGLTAINATSGLMEAQLTALHAPIAFGDGAVWATGPAGTIQKIDPISKAPVGPSIHLARDVMALSANGGLLWALVRDKREVAVIRIEAASRRVLSAPTPLQTGGDPQDAFQMAAAPGGALVTERLAGSSSATAVQIDGRTGRILKSPIPVPDGGTLVDTTAAFGRYWVLEGGGLFAIDARSGRLVGTRHLPLLDGIATGARTVWLLELSDGDYVSVLRIDPTSLKVIGAPIHVQSTPGDTAADGRRVWVITDRIRAISP